MKKLLTFLLVFSMVFAVSCGGAEEAEPDPKPDEGEALSLAHQALSTAAEGFFDMGSGRLTVETNDKAEFLISGTESVEFTQNVEYDYTLDFEILKNGYNFIKITNYPDEGIQYGTRQQDGISTAFSYKSYDDGTYEWSEGAALAGNYELPYEAAMFNIVGELEEIESLSEKEEGDGVRYIVKYNDQFQEYFGNTDDLMDYYLTDCVARYLVDGSGNLTEVLWAYTEHYTLAVNDVANEVVMNLTLSNMGKPVDMDYFKNAGNHIPVAYTDITETQREFFINIPETFLLDVSIPRVKPGLANADKINDQIAIDCSFELSATADSLESETSWGGYPWHETYYEVYKFGTVYEIVIFNVESSAYGSGASMWMYKYYYDTEAGDVMSEENFLAYMTYTPDMVVKTFNEDYLGDMALDAGVYTYEEITNWYYFDKDGQIQFFVNFV